MAKKTAKKPSPLVEIKIANRTYKKLADQKLYVNPELKEILIKRKRRDGTNAYDQLTTMGFKGGKHLIELIRKELGNKTEVVLSHDKSSLSGKRIEVNLDGFKEAGESEFFDVYRQAGIRGATRFLNDKFPDTFTATADDVLPRQREVRRVLSRLPEAAEAVAKKDRKKLPDQIADLVERMDPDLVYGLLSSVDAAIPKGQERMRVAFQQVIERLSQEPAKALQELSDLMDRWNLLQVTSLVNVLRSRLNAIETFESLILDEGTYELKTDNSIHRTLEKSMWLLNDEYWIAQSNKTLRTLIGTQLAKSDKAYEKRRPDFACVDALGKTVLVEIKRPSLELKKPEIDQAELYLRITKKHQGSTFKKPTIFLIGNKISNEARELADMRNYPILKTYQEMIEGARRRYQEYLRIVEDG